jgi:hypothetical protein
MAIAKCQAVVAHKRWMAFHNHSFEPVHLVRDRRMIGKRDRSAVEEAATVVELDCPRGVQLLQRNVYLRGDDAGLERVGERVLPQVAHHAAPWAFAICQQNGCDRLRGAAYPALFFVKERVRQRGIEHCARRPLGNHPRVELNISLLGREGHRSLLNIG